ncbi:MAG: hypothetical protein GYA36_21625 [Veillonellaceae bacterium]|nr:hypothetical protein [Veillonellaceae bacterium]
MMKDERVCKRPSTKAKLSALTDKRVLEALEREEAQGTTHPEHLARLKERLKERLKGVKA